MKTDQKADAFIASIRNMERTSAANEFLRNATRNVGYMLDGVQYPYFDSGELTAWHNACVETLRRNNERKAAI